MTTLPPDDPSLSEDLAQLRRLVRALAGERAVGADQVPQLVRRDWVREMHAGHDAWLELTEAGRDALADAVEPDAAPAPLTVEEWARRFAARRAERNDRSTPEELDEEGRRLFPILGDDMSPESAADAVSSQWGDL